MIEKLKMAFADSDWDMVDLILLPRDELDAEAMLAHIPEEHQRRWEQHMKEELQDALGLNAFDDGSPLCDPSPGIKEEDGTDVIPW